jgi:ATP-dependent DNA helicase RecQ
MQHDEIQTHFKKRFPDFAAQWSLTAIQIEAIQKTVDSPSAMAIMPTGSGKSMVYWMAASIIGGTCIVVSPLIALIDEQAKKLRDAGFSAVVLHSGVRQKDQIELLRTFVSGEQSFDFIFVSPERIATDTLFETAIRMRKQQVKLVVVDEIHCVSQWGADFRPFYRRIPAFLDRIFGKTGWPKLLGLTATLNPKDRREISEDFRIAADSHVVHHHLMRTEIALSVQRLKDEDEKESRFWELLELHRGKKTLVYLYRKIGKRSTESLASEAADRGFNAIFFHGDMTGRERADAISEVQATEDLIVFATNAFGMGIDIPDIRVVIHYMIPESVEQYYQEVGRAARDGAPAEAYLLYTDTNVKVRRDHFIDRSFPDIDRIRDTFTKITSNGLDVRSMKFFDDEDVQRAFTYLVDNGVLNVLGTGFTGLRQLKPVEDSPIVPLVTATRTGNAISTARKRDVSLIEMFAEINEAILSGMAEVEGSLDKCMFVQAANTEIDETTATKIRKDMEEKRDYKHNLLDYLVSLCANFTRSEEMHQEIGLFLGVDKHQVGRIYETSRGDRVRSKSEVIIANLLWSIGVEYEYEQKLYYQPGKWIEPDFTITVENKTYYWEHLGMLGLESYDKRWIGKRKIYEQYFPEQLVVTHESAVLSRHAKDVMIRHLGISTDKFGGTDDE